MSFVTTQPEDLSVAAEHLTAVGMAVTAMNAAVSDPTIGLIPAAADEVSALVADAFAAHGALFQDLGAQAAVIHQMFVATLQASAGSYALTEVANAAAAR
ncbi:PE family protein [Mycobacterium sp. HNNTM2301]|uniref:PE family protein n=1 Tax=Mycobacterium hainanense TaxID=3289775 RepID=UPI0035A62EF0